MGKPETKPEVPFSSNAIRLSPREWSVAAVALLALLLFVPRLWGRIEPFAPGPDFRMPYKLCSDYWLYERYCRAAASSGKTLLIGDSVIWGQYVKADETLSHHLNALAGADRFANMGMDGMHPAALSGLVKYYGLPVSGKKVILFCNPLWMSSDKADLSADKEFSFNHPELVPQFFPRIPCYTESLSGRLGIEAERGLPFFAWANHLRVAYLDSMDIPAWTMEHPYASLASAISLQLPVKEEKLKRRPALWTGKEQDKQDFAWVGLEQSLQWKCFRNTVETLERRGNRVFVLVGPFNEHMIRKNSLGAYMKLKAGIEKWLREGNIPHLAPPALPSEQYADASHPWAKGYERLAGKLFQSEGFRSTILEK